MAIQHGNRGITKKDLQLYYNREFLNSFRGEATTNLANTIYGMGPNAGFIPVNTTAHSGIVQVTDNSVDPPVVGATVWKIYNSDPDGYSRFGIGQSGNLLVSDIGGYDVTYVASVYVYIPTGVILGGAYDCWAIQNSTGVDWHFGDYTTSPHPTFGYYAKNINSATVQANPNIRDKWQRISVTFTPTSVARDYGGVNNCKYLTVQFRPNLIGTNGSSFIYVSCMQVERKSYATPFVPIDNRPENTTNITLNPSFTSSISGTNSGGTQNNWTFGSWSGTGNSYITQTSTTIYTNQTNVRSSIPLRVTRAAAGSMDFLSTSWNTLTNGTVYTLSLWARASTNTVTLDMVHQNLGTLKANAVTTSWKKYSVTFTHAGGTNYPYLRHNGSTGTWIEVTDVQLEAKAYATDFTATNRTSLANTPAYGGGLVDISGNNNNSSLANAAFDSAGYYFTTAGNNYVNTGITTLPSNTQLTIDVWTKPTSTTQTKTLVSKWGSSAQFNFCFLLFLNWFAQGNIYFLVGSANGDGYSNHSIPHNLSTSAYSNFTIVYDNGNISWYRNGVFIQTETNGNQRLRSVNTPITIGADYDGGNPDTLTRNYDGTIPNVRLYSRPLTASEVLQNFNATRATYGL